MKIRTIFPFRSYPTRNTNFEKNSKKIQKTKKYHYGFISIQNRSEEAKNNQKYELSFRSVHTWREIENSKTIAKKFKKLKNTITGSFQAKIGRRRPRKIENKSYRSVSFLSGTKQKIKKKIAKKFKKVKNTIMISFQTKIRGKMMRKRENKNYNFVPFVPDA